jgi:hypothetical protein
MAGLIFSLFLFSPCLNAQTRIPAQFLNALSLSQERQAGVGASSLSKPPVPETLQEPQEPQSASSGKAAGQSPGQSSGGPLPDQPSPQAAQPANSDQSDDHPKVKFTKRILGIIPNFQAVSVDTYLPPLSVKQKFWISTQNSFDYSAFISVGIQAGVEEATNTYPEFRQGAAGYGRYFWHTFTDQAVGNYVVGAIFPSITHEDSRFYILNRGGFWHRATYAFSRVVITRKDDGGKTFNYSEVVGNAAVAAISPLYYPSQERNWNEYGERWVTSIVMDGVFNLLQEFWPDINHKILRR